MGFEFGGVNDGVSLDSPATLDNIWAGGGTISGWIFIRSFGEAAFGRVFNKSSANTGANGWSLFVDDSGGASDRLRFIRAFGTTFGDWATPISSISLNTWIHFILTYNDDSVANIPAFYLDGVAQTLTTLATPVGTFVTDAAQEMNIGNLNSDSTIRTFDGFMADMRIYNREVDAVEAQIIANGHGVDGIANGLIGWWKMTDTTADFSGQDLYSSGSTNSIGSSTSITVSLASQQKDGDTLIMIIASSGDSSGVPENITTPAGWTHINSGQTDLPSTLSTPSLWVFRRTASSEPASYVVTGDQTTTKLGTIMNFRDMALTEDVVSSINTGTSTAPVAPSVTAGDNAVALRICVGDDDDIVPDSSVNFPSGVNMRKSFELIGVGNGVSLLVATELVDSGATGTRTFTLVASEEWGCLTITFLGGQGARDEYLLDYSDNAHPSVIYGGPRFNEEHPDIKRRRAR